MQEERDSPTVSTCLPILISSEFLQIHSLVQECTTFMAENFFEILRTPVDLVSLSAKNLRRLSEILTESTLEEIYLQGIPREKIKNTKDGDDTSRLDSKHAVLVDKLFKQKLELILEQGTERIHRCSNCFKVYSSKAHPELVCPKAKIFIDFHGSVVALHRPAAKWNMEKYLNELHRHGYVLCLATCTRHRSELSI